MGQTRLLGSLTGEKPLRWLFLDLNSYFASVEQAEHPEYRGKPIAVAPTKGENGTVIAASYEAKKFGIRTGTKTGEARRMCPEITFVSATPALYVHYHKRVLQVLGDVLPIDRVCSIDEMRFRLLGEERDPVAARRIAARMKEVLREMVSPWVTASVGIAPNAFLAKLATDMMKPDGLVVLEEGDLPDKLRGMPLTEFPGINKRMEARLMAAGMFKSDDLVDASKEDIVRAFGGPAAETWWYLLRGYDLDYQSDSNKSLGHSHVLPPDLRTDAGARSVLLRLTHKACARLRQNKLWATRVSMYVQGRESWHAESRLAPTQDAITVQKRLLEMWEQRDFSKPLQVGITFTGLRPGPEVTPSLFEDTVAGSNLGHAVDAMNKKFGKNSVYLAGLHEVKHTASEKIAFNKTWLFDEGKDEHAWPDTFRGHPEAIKADQEA